MICKSLKSLTNPTTNLTLWTLEKCDHSQQAGSWGPPETGDSRTTGLNEIRNPYPCCPLEHLCHCFLHFQALRSARGQVGQCPTSPCSTILHITRPVLHPDPHPIPLTQTISWDGFTSKSPTTPASTHQLSQPTSKLTSSVAVMHYKAGFCSVMVSHRNVFFHQHPSTEKKDTLVMMVGGQ